MGHCAACVDQWMGMDWTAWSHLDLGDSGMCCLSLVCTLDLAASVLCSAKCRGMQQGWSCVI